jgi:hypothetical protein
VTLYLYIFIDELPRYEAEGWTLAGKMRPDDWASLNRGNLIVCKPDDKEDLWPASEL